MCPNCDLAFPGKLKSPGHDLGIARMEPAGDIGGRDDRQHGVVVAAGPAAGYGNAVLIDQGTEFGVEVAPGGGSRVHVLKGQVDVTLNGRTAPPTQRCRAQHWKTSEEQPRESTDIATLQADPERAQASGREPMK